ncbi:MAG: L-glutamate gamma-semialdehyde dehydrogenase [candidate division WOR-3 bacterium]|nr:L-glutamate gamma-semialdehyde dehydrogenase [candidate division WOR-3 bacterium]MCX7947902.1 L-glutamate gamma-semialdehyde dehydrogenase [candidate division WOR-3 bacterium]MDW8150724.1 L-glutamate gamma-semialdehyde dehydrogenase [candidate division WOR-3 bacterium]
MLRPFQPEPYIDYTKEENKNALKNWIERYKNEFPLRIPLFIDGKEIYKNETFKSISPNDRNLVVAEVSSASVEDVEKAINSAHRAFKSWANLSVEERVNLILKAAKRLRERRFEIVSLMSHEVSKNWLEADADIAEAIDFCEYYSREMLDIQRHIKGGLYYLQNEHNTYFYIPLGVVAVIPPWNFPLAILTGMTIAALVTGNTVVLKPASDAPAVGYKLIEVLKEVGIPDGVINYVPGPGGIIGDYLVEHPLVRMIAFTGSKEVGSRIYELASKVRPNQKFLKRVIAEMGGKDPIIVDSSAKLDDYLYSQIVISAFGFQGQKCSAASRLIVVEDIYDEVIEGVVEYTKKLTIGPSTENYNFNAVINAGAEKKILQYIEIGKSEGKLILGGEKANIGIDGFYVMPTIFKDVSPKAKIAQEEIFGPVLSIIKAKDFDEAIAIANDSEYGLTGAVFARDRYKIEKAKRELMIGNLYINRKCTGAIVGVHPFGGFNMSGTDAKAGGPDYLLYFLQGKSISEVI